MDEVKLMEIADRMDTKDRMTIATAISEAFETWESTGYFCLPGFLTIETPNGTYNDLLAGERQYEKSNNEISYKTDSDFKFACVAWFMIGVMLGVCLMMGGVVFYGM